MYQRGYKKVSKDYPELKIFFLILPIVGDHIVVIDVGLMTDWLLW